MCLIITTLCALLSALLFLGWDKENAHHTRTLFLMYGAAAAMWFTDRLFAVAEGEEFLELTLSDACLGFTVALCAPAALFLYHLKDRWQSTSGSLERTRESA